MNRFKTKIIRSLAEFQACRTQWDDLYHRSRQIQATAQHELVANYWKHFLPSESVYLHVLLDSTTEQWLAVLPLSQHNLWRMLPTAHNFSNPWVIGLTCLWADDVEPASAVNELLSSVRQTGAVMLTLDLVSNEDPFVQAVCQSNAGVDQRVVNSLELFRVGKTMLASSWEEFIKSWSKKRRRFIRRACEQLGEVGNFQMQTLHSAKWPEIESAWARCLHVESMGWKGENGSDLAGNPHAKKYFEKLLQHLYHSQELRFYTLELDGRLIAYDLGYLRHRVATSMKVSYHPEFTEYSPGHVLNSLVIQDLIAKQEADWIDTVGELNSANSKWCSESYSCQRIEVSLGSWVSRTAVRSKEWLRVIKRRLTEKEAAVSNTAASESNQED
ncbi:MAG: GNAT family N-acetyltransferase [Planctomycetaceae bacterium]|nr:GNAT family N-acetyltransferase [Planctomycetaceae bacterium]